MPAAKAIGIDLGTTNSCVAVFENGGVTVLSNAYSKRTTPSLVGFIDDMMQVGTSVKKVMRDYPEEVIYSIKRLIGRRYDDPKVQEDIENFLYKVVSKDGNAAVEVEYCGDKTVFIPEQISALILENMISIANNYLLPFEVKDAVITIPAYFNDSQRQATIDAARIAGINVLRLINEPTAAALAYAYKEKWQNGNLLVYDLGGGTFDVSIIEVTDGCCEVRKVGGDTHLGGEDFDNLMVKYCIGEFQRIHGDDISNNREAVCKLKVECEDAKKRLSMNKSALVKVVKLFDGKDLSCTITQDKFNELCKDLIEKTLVAVRDVLEEAELTKDDITNVVLIGGSTRIPYIRTTLGKLFDLKKLRFDIDPDEAVANGAAILAAHLSKSFDTSIRDILVRDIIPHSLGTDLYHSSRDKKGEFYVVAERHTPFPLIKKIKCSTLKKDQTRIDFGVYEGENADFLKNKELGSFALMNVAPGRPGDLRIEITFSVDENAILTVTAVDEKSGSAEYIEIRPNKGRLSDAEVLESSKQNTNLKIDV